MKLFYIACLLIHMIDYVMGNSTKICSLPINPGHCKDLVPRFGYRPSKKECISFMFGGCKGNANNFESIMDCESECKGKKKQ